MFLECTANKDSATMANYSFLWHYTWATIQLLFTRHVLFFNPKISVWAGFLVCINVWISDCHFRMPLGILIILNYKKKNSTTFLKKYIIILSLSETKNKHMNSAANLWNVSQNCRNIHDSSFSLCQWLPQWADNESITENNKYEWAHKNEDDYRTGHRLYTMCTTYANFNNVRF